MSLLLDSALLHAVEEALYARQTLGRSYRLERSAGSHADSSLGYFPGILAREFTTCRATASRAARNAGSASRPRELLGVGRGRAWRYRRRGQHDCVGNSLARSADATKIMT